MVRSRRLIYNGVPEREPVIRRDIVVESYEFDIFQDPPDEGVVTQTLFASLDPYIRCRMTNSDFPFSFSKFNVGQTIVTFSISKVLSSWTYKYFNGDIILGMFPLEEYSVLTHGNLSGSYLISNSHLLDLEIYLSALGMPGFAAYSVMGYMLELYAEQTIFISSAAGAVGQIVGQFAKMEGLHVIGSVGTYQKLNYIKNELGYHDGFNYKLENPTDALQRIAPRGIDIYYDNVGGEQLDAALKAMKPCGTIIACGMISDYNKPVSESYSLQNWTQIHIKSIKVKGYMLNPFITEKTAKSRVNLMREGLFRSWFRYKTSITKGIENGPRAFVGMFRGENFGKTVLQIANDADIQQVLDETSMSDSSEFSVSDLEW